MIIDSSVLAAQVLNEPDAPAIADAMARDNRRLISACNALEVEMVIVARKHEAGARKLHQLMAHFQIEIVSFTEEQLEIACHAFRRYGKGRHPAALNYGDCFAYALAKETGEPILCKGTDFGKTDLKIVSF